MLASVSRLSVCRRSRSLMGARPLCVGRGRHRRGPIGLNDRERRSRFGLAPHFAQQPTNRIVVVVGNAFFERNDPVVRDVNALGTDLGTALRYVAESDLDLVLDELPPVERVQWVHVEGGEMD